MNGMAGVAAKEHPSPCDILRGYASRVLTGPVAQLVEHRTFNAVVAGSIPARLTIICE